MHFLSTHATLWSHVLALQIILVGPIVSYFYERPLLRSLTSSQQKVGFYRYIIFAQWTLAAAGLWISGPRNLFFPPSNQGHGLPAYGHVLFGTLLAAFFILGLMPLFQSLRGEKFRAAYAAAYRRSLDDVSKLLPDTHIERLWFAAISITAGMRTP